VVATAGVADQGTAGHPVGNISTEASEGEHDVSAERLFTLISSVIALIGLGLGWLIFTKNPVREMPRILENKYHVDEIYDAAIIVPIEKGSRVFLWKVVDVGIIDGFVNGLAQAFSGAAGVLRRSQTGYARGYAAAILLGAIVVLGFFALR
jgi:NADH-quinone oxidoreductase subunit L